MIKFGYQLAYYINNKLKNLYNNYEKKSYDPNYCLFSYEDLEKIEDLVLDYVDNVYRYMYNAQVYVLNSFYEGMPNALLEAMACNLPIIATDAPGGTREIVSSSISANLINMEKINYEDYGILIKPCDSKMYSAADPLTQEEINLADAIITLLSNKSLMEKYKKNSNKRIKDFDKSKILAMWESIL